VLPKHARYQAAPRPAAGRIPKAIVGTVLQGTAQTIGAAATERGKPSEDSNESTEEAPMATTTKEKTKSSSRRTESRSSTRDEAGRGASRSRRPQRSNEGGEIRATNLGGEDRKFLERHSSNLSKSTLRARWIGDPKDHQERPGQTLATRNPDVIRAWAEARDARPATVGRARDDGQIRTLRFDFGAEDTSGRLRPIDWESWLGTFERRKLVFLFQEQRRNGDDSNFFRLDSPEREEG
jgi:hypothetical protein